MLYDEQVLMPCCSCSYQAAPLWPFALFAIDDCSIPQWSRMNVNRRYLIWSIHGVSATYEPDLIGMCDEGGM